MKTLPMFLHFAGGTIMPGGIRDRTARILRPLIRIRIATVTPVWTRRGQPRLCLRTGLCAKAGPAMGLFMGACAG